MPTKKENTNKPSYNFSKEDKEYLGNLLQRFTDLETYRSGLKANPYDLSPKARSLEKTWDFCDYVSLPHKYWDKEMQGWECTNSIPLIFSKIDTALSILIKKNPEAEFTAQNKKYEKKTKIQESLYSKSWDKAWGQQQLIKLIYSIAKYGFGVGREYHLYVMEDKKEIVGYDPEKLKHVTEKRKKIVHDCAYFETLPIRQCWFDNRAKPYDKISMRDWMWEVEYDETTFKKFFPVEKYPNAKYVQFTTSSSTTVRDKANIQDTIPGNKVKLRFYENKETNEFVITDKQVLLYKDILVNGDLSCVWGMWRIRNDQTIYGIGLCEILENPQELLDKVSNMTINQLMLVISGSGWYGGVGNINEQDMVLAPKLKPLRDAEKIIFPKIPAPDPSVWQAKEDLKNEADEISGITKSLTGEIVGKTLGEAVLNKEAGLARLSQPLQNIEFALEHQARLRIKNLQYIYSKPVNSAVIRNELGMIIDEKLWNEYRQELAMNGQTRSMIQKYPEDQETGMLYRNFFKEERLPLEKTPEGETIPSEKDQWLEITPDEIDGEYDVRIKAFSAIPMSKTLEEARALETFNLFAKMPYVDLYKLMKNTLQKRGEDPDDVLVNEQQIMQQQQEADQTRQMQGQMQADQQSQEQQIAMMKAGGGKVVPQEEVQQPAAMGGLSPQITQSLQMK